MPIASLLSESIIRSLVYLTAILFASKTIRDSFYLLWLLQVKEYRLDRTRAHFRDNMRLNISDIATASAAFILLGLFFPATARFIVVFALLFLGSIAPFYFLYGTAKFVWEIYSHSFKRPKPTLKIILISAVYLSSYAIFVFFLSENLSQKVNIVYSFDFFVIFSLYLLLLNILLPLFVLLAAILITPFSDFKKRKIIREASLKMRKMKHIKTIGITGSFGKTSTKEFLYAILSSKYKVIKTEGNNNTDMGVARTVLEKAEDDYDFFICEMGAYRIGEIREISRIACPFAGIITGINEQHLDLFGSIQNTKKAKFELVQSIPKEGFAVINRKAYEMQPRIDYDAENVLFDKEMAENIQIFPDHIEFTYKKTALRANLLGKHYIENLLAAIIVAEKLGMSLEEIRSAILQTDFTEKHLMRIEKGPKEAIFIDDSYSANPDGVIAGLEYLETAYPKAKKIFVFPGIIELGKDSRKIQEKLWKKADDICSLVFAMRKEDKEMKKKYQKSRFIFGRDFDKITRELRNHLDDNTVVLFESRGAAVVMKKILSEVKEK